MKKIVLVVTATVVAVGLGLVVGFLTTPKKAPQTCGHGAKKPVEQRVKEDCASHKSCGSTNSGPVAVVNGVAIKRSLYESALRDKRESGDSSATVAEDVLANLIEVELLYQAAKDEGVQLDSGVGTMRAAMVKRAQKEPALFAQRLAERGLSQEEYEHEWYRQATITFYIEDVIESSVEVSDATLKRLYKRLAKGSDEKPRPFEEVRPSLEEAYVKEKTKVLIEEKIAALKAAATIERSL